MKVLRTNSSNSFSLPIAELYKAKQSCLEKGVIQNSAKRLLINIISNLSRIGFS